MTQNTFPHYIYITYLQDYPRWLYLQIFQDENMFLFLTVVWIHKLNYEVYVTCFRLEFTNVLYGILWLTGRPIHQLLRRKDII